MFPAFESRGPDPGKHIKEVDAAVIPGSFRVVGGFYLHIHLREARGLVVVRRREVALVESCMSLPRSMGKH